MEFYELQTQLVLVRETFHIEACVYSETSSDVQTSMM